MQWVPGPQAGMQSPAGPASGIGAGPGTSMGTHIPSGVQ